MTIRRQLRSTKEGAMMAKLNMQQAEVSRIMDMIDEYHAVLNDESGHKKRL